MKKLQILMAVVLLAFFISCTEETTPVKPDPKETNSIELKSVEGTDITGSMAFLPGGDTELLLSFHTTITNKGTRELKLYSKMEIIELAEDQASYFCWGDIDKGEGICYPPLTEDFLSDRTMTVKAGETTPKGNFLQYLSCDNPNGGEAKIRYIVFEDGNEANRDTIIYNISITN
ncbi:MAG: hypothetical protein RIF34_02615 [Candidatus Kapaibacterium sp.]